MPSESHGRGLATLQLNPQQQVVHGDLHDPLSQQEGPLSGENQREAADTSIP